MIITGSITAALHVQLIVHTLLSIITGHISFTLLTDYITNQALFTLKIIPNRIRLIRCIPIFEDWSPLYDF